MDRSVRRKGYLVALGSTAAVAVLRLALWSWIEHRSPFLPFVAAVMVTSWYGGLGPGLLATALGALASMFVVLPPVRSFAVASPHDVVWLVMFVGIGVLTSVLCEALHSARGRLEAHVARVEEQARLLDLTQDAILVRDLEDRVRYWNRGAEALYGFSPGEAVGRITHDLLHTEFPQPLDQIRAAVDRGGRWEGDLVHVRKDGARLCVSSRWAADRSADGALVAILEINHDVTARRAAEEELRAADRRKDRFLATLAHELRNPLAAVVNGLELLRRPEGPGRIGQVRGLLERQVRQLVRLVDDLLDASRLTRGAISLRKERVDLATALDEAVETARPLMDAAGHTIALALPPEPLEVSADPVRLGQVFANLLNNAAKYTERGGRVEVTAERCGREAVVSVRDTGIGLSPEQLPHIFEMFSQVALERSQGGLGVGLALARGLAELHGGSLTARSEGLGRGSEFVVVLPLLDEPELVRPAPAARAPAAPHRILVVDDLRDTAESLAMLLRCDGHEVRTAHDGLEAVAVAEAFRPDVVLLDIGLPKLDGYSVARRIRQEPWGRELRLVALTGWGQEEDKRRAAEAGFDRHLTKPVDLEVLEAVLSGP